MKRKFILFLFVITTISSFAYKEKWDEPIHRREWTKLMLAIYNGETEKYHKLISQGANVNQKGFHLTALEVAVYMQNTDAVRTLLQTNKIKNLDSSLDLAAGRQNALIVELLLKYGANPNTALTNGHSVLMTAINFGSLDVVKCFLKHNANVNHTRTTDGMTPLMFAALAGDFQKARLLLYYKANKKAKDLNGKTALDWVNDSQSHASEKAKSELRTLLR